MTAPSAAAQHRWAVVVVASLDDQAAAELQVLDAPERFEALSSILELAALEQVRGPICLQCRVHWRDVYAKPDKPWPCPGIRPQALGGPLVQSGRRTRSESRRERRQADRAAAAAGRSPAANQAMSSIESAIARGAMRRRTAQDVSRSAGEALETVGAALSAADDLDGYWDGP